ncbi:hypothetical protein [Microbulbifer sp.]|uniref:hypothetical protein n=1 Tax=Microbulbifer sp. TaxID=1908541 RepID=UPI003F671A30
MAVEVQLQPGCGKVATSTLGLKDVAPTTDLALKLETGRWYRDAARNIIALGNERLAGGIPSL